MMPMEGLIGVCCCCRWIRWLRPSRAVAVFVAERASLQSVRFSMTSTDGKLEMWFLRKGSRISGRSHGVVLI